MGSALLRSINEAKINSELLKIFPLLVKHNRKQYLIYIKARELSATLRDLPEGVYYKLEIAIAAPTDFGKQ